MSGGKVWSLRRRMAAQFALAATLFLGVIGVSVSIAYRCVLTAELDEEVTEQVDAFTAGYGAGPGGEEEFCRWIAASVAETSETPMAWRALSAGDPSSSKPGGGVETWGPYGRRDLVLSLDRAPQELGVSRTIRRGLIVRRIQVREGLEVVVALDGTDWLDRARFADLGILIVLLLGSGVSVLAGRIFGGRVAVLVERVALRVDAARAAGSTPDASADGLPLEVRQITESLTETLVDARAEVDRTRLLTAGLAHDLRAPVQSLLASTQVALLDPDERTRSLLDGHLAELRSLARTIDNLVAWGAPRQLAGGETVLATLDLGAEVGTRLTSEEDSAGRAGVFLDRLCTGDLTLRGDPHALVLAIRNLVGNAIAWSPKGGQVTVCLTGDDRGILVSVEDEGPGVPIEERERVFQPFVRGDAAPGRRAGYGLGLAIVAEVSRRHSGEARVTDAASGGARFELWIPRVSE